MSELYDKKLEKNYGKVQKTEIKYNEKKDKNLSSYDRKLKSIANQRKKETKVQNDTVKQLKLETKAFLQELKELQKDRTSKLNNKHKEDKKRLKDDLDEIEKRFKDEITQLQEQKKTESTKHTTEIKELAQKQKKVQTSFSGKEKRAVKRFDGMKNKEKKAIKDRKKQAESTIKALQEERDNKVKELSEASQQEISSLYEVIAFRRGKADDMIVEAEKKHNEIMEGIDKEELGATVSYDTKVQKNERALEEKIARRNKFLQKAESQGDIKNVKLQNREIKTLEQQSERELRILKNEYDRLIKDIELKRTVEDRRYLEELAEIERGFAQFKQEQLWAIELNTISNAEQITNIKLETEKKLYSERMIFDQIDIDYEAELGRLEKEKQIAINDLQDLALKQDVEFNKIRDSKVLDYDMYVAQNEKEIRILQHKKDIEKNKKNSAFDIEIVEYEIAQQLLAEEIQYKTTKQIEEELIEMHKNDYKKQASIRSEYKDSIKELSEVRVERAKDQLEFEELEIENRISIKKKFLEDQKDVIMHDQKLLLTRIENAQKEEIAFFKSVIKQIEKQEQDILKKNILKETKEIKKLQADLTAIEADEGEQDTSEITTQLQALNEVVTRESEATQKIIDTKIAIMNDNIAIIESRKELEREDAKVLVERELRNISYALELLDQNKIAELTEAKARYNKTLNVYHDLSNDTARKDAMKKEEHQRFMNIRVDSENAILSEAKASYNQSVDLLEETKARKIASIKDTLVSNNKLQQDAIDDTVTKYAAAHKESVHRKAIIHNTAEATIQDREKKHMKKEEEIDVDYNKVIANKNKQLKAKDTEFKGHMARIEKSIQVENKKYEEDRRKAQRAYEIELKKAISTINKKLDLDSKLV